MAERPVFIPCENGDFLVKTCFVGFEWYPGFSISQKQKSINSLHSNAKRKLNISSTLEISSKSPDMSGVAASAFNLKITTKKLNKTFSVECAFQASKKFERGGPFVDLLEKSSIDAKKDERLRNSGRLVEFRFYNTFWPLEPKTMFYDWLYINALHSNPELAKRIIEHDSYTDIEFNHERSINCQAYSAALYKALFKRDLLEKALSSQESYVEIINSYKTDGARDNNSIQPGLV
ncbi:DarT1-associated NADAR antitoxin family protein [Pseudomonas sp. C11]|uniref:DarT1-associated NADAR antitoxin family protein n=1 Tax=Pseudomonas sp. C11 TaxID=3075550 RepID=UPI002AFEE428|nr:hypothetical protein [Pseudomonas sp. C11]